MTTEQVIALAALIWTIISGVAAFFLRQLNSRQNRFSDRLAVVENKVTLMEGADVLGSINSLKAQDVLDRVALTEIRSDVKNLATKFDVVEKHIHSQGETNQQTGNVLKEAIQVIKKLKEKTEGHYVP